MTPLRQRMLDALVLRGMATRTQEAYIDAVARLARHYRRSPDTLTADEVQPVLRALRKSGIHVVALHNHMIGEQPAMYFTHFWGKGTAEELARSGGGEIHWLIGADMLLYLPHWHRPLELLRRVRFVVVARPGKPSGRAGSNRSEGARHGEPEPGAGPDQRAGGRAGYLAAARGGSGGRPAS